MWIFFVGFIGFYEVIHNIHNIHNPRKPLKILGFVTFYLFYFLPDYDSISLLKNMRLGLLVMGQFKVYQDYSADATLVSNVFIDNYMKDANDAQIKIYLYLLRVLSSKRGCSISDLADQFNYTEKDVQRALKYWERNGLISLEFDENKNLVGVRLQDVVHKKEPSVSLAPVVPIPIKNEQETLEETPKYVKPDYSTDEIKAFKSNEVFGELLFVVESYIGHPLTPSNIKSVLFISDELGFSPELIDYLFEYCVGKDKRDFRYIEKVAISWKEAGVTNPKQAAKMSLKYEKYVYDIMKALGRSSNPTKLEVDYIYKWTKSFGFDMDVIEEACNRSVLATDGHRFEYTDGILSNWHEAKVHHKADIEALDAEHAKKKGTSSSSTGQVPAYKKFDSRDYDFDELEKQILSN